MTSRTLSVPRRSPRPWARYTNVALGFWLFLSAFLWDHTVASRANSWIVGVLIVAFASWALLAPAARYLNTVAGLWLIVSAWWFPHETWGTVVHNVAVGAVVLIVSLLPSRSELSGPGSRPILRT